MKVYEINPDDDGWPHEYEIDAAHRWSLPGVKCGKCGFVGGSVGLQYPALTLPIGVDAEPYLAGWPVSPEEQSRLQTQLLQAWGSGMKLAPGTEFGPLAGKAWGLGGDIAWVNPWTPLATCEAAERMSEAGIDSLALVATELKWRSKKAPSYLEIQILPGPKLSPAYVDALGGELAPCVMCGVLGPPPPELPDRSARLAYAELENDPVLDAASLPAEWDLLRVQDCEGTIVASERFRNTVVELGLTNITFREVKVAVSEPVG